MILLVGGTADLGGRVVHLLRGQGHQVRCLAWAETQESALGQLGAAVVRGELTEPRTLPPACEAQTPLVQVSLQWDGGLRALATPPSSTRCVPGNSLARRGDRTRPKPGSPDADSGGMYPTDEFAPAGHCQGSMTSDPAPT